MRGLEMPPRDADGTFRVDENTQVGVGDAVRLGSDCSRLLLSDKATGRSLL